MNRKTLFLVVAICCALVIVAAASTNPNVGTWKLNESKSKFAPGSPKNMTVTYTAEGDSYKCVVDGVNGAGQPTHNEWTGKFDGKDYAVTGDPSSDTRALEQVNDHHYKLSNKKAGKETVTGTIDISKDGKTRTLKTHATDASGKPVNNIAVYEKQ